MYTPTRLQHGSELHSLLAIGMRPTKHPHHLHFNPCHRPCWLLPGVYCTIPTAAAGRPSPPAAAAAPPLSFFLVKRNPMVQKPSVSDEGRKHMYYELVEHRRHYLQRQWQRQYQRHSISMRHQRVPVTRQHKGLRRMGWHGTNLLVPRASFPSYRPDPSRPVPSRPVPSRPKTRQGRTRQDKARQGRTRQD